MIVRDIPLKPVSTGPSIAIMFTAFGPYLRARLKAAGASGQTIIGLEGAPGDEVHDWGTPEPTPGIKQITLFDDTPIAFQPRWKVRRRVWAALDEQRPDVVATPGWATHFANEMLAWALANRVPALVMSDSQEIDFRRVAVKEWVKRKIIGTYSAALVAGEPHVEYLERLGLPRERIFTGYDVVDNAYFANGAANARANAAELRRELALPEKFFLASGRLVARKNQARVIDAFARYRAQAGADAWHLVLVGDGPSRPEIERQIDTLGLREMVHLAGYKQYASLPAYYGLASAFVLASLSEQWGLVVNEAMASGLPIIVSTRCGCARDLVENGDNGFAVDPMDVNAIAEAMIAIASPGSNRELMGRRSVERIAQWGPEAFSEGLRRAAAMAVSNPLPLTTLDRTLVGLMTQAV